MADLQRRVIAFLEGRRASELADLVERHNGIPLAAPCLREVHSPDSPVLQASIEGVLSSTVDVAIFLTGVGATTVFESAALMGRDADLRDLLQQATVVVRGPKLTAPLRKFGLSIDHIAQPPNTSAEVLEVLADVDLRGKNVVVQLYGEPNPKLSQDLADRGASVLELAPYVWGRPVDPKPIVHLLDELDSQRVDALLITSQAQVDNLFDVAGEAGRRPALSSVAIGAQGPVCEAALGRRGLLADFSPRHPHMGALVLAAAEYLTTEGSAGR
jgi:uroporphyrinogen-III synthase